MILKSILKKLIIKNMKFNGLLIATLILFIVSLLSYYLTKSDISCVVYNADNIVVNGFYEGYGGVYVKKIFNSNYIPDIFSLIKMKRLSSNYMISFTNRMWTINDLSKQMTLYINQPEHPEDYIYQPPKLGWINVLDQMKKPSHTSVTNCIGSLENSQSIAINHTNDNNNIQELLQRPITTILLMIIFYVAYFLWAYRIDVSDVSYSYEKFYLNCEYWRGITASFSHFDILHLAFNTMTLYQLGILEQEYGSLPFLYLNIDLVIITMLICTLIYHVMITKYGRTDMISMQAVGYSCVLFAWMVALSVRLEEYCPIFLFPTFCIKTWFIPLPTIITKALSINTGIPVNLGPFVLLFLTKFIMPRSSLIGHLSGIIIGYPLGWNMLNWFTPPLLISTITLITIIQQQWYIWRYPGYYQLDNIDLESFITSSMIRYYKIMYVLSYFIILFIPIMTIFMGFEQFILRILEGFLVLSAVHASRIDWSIEIYIIKEQCNHIMIFTTIYLFLCFIYDISTLISWFTASDYILYGSNNFSYGYILYATQACGLLTVIELILIYLLMMRLLDTSSVAASTTASLKDWLLICRCDLRSIQDDMKSIEDIVCCSYCCGRTCYDMICRNRNTTVQPFSGVAYRLISSSSPTTLHHSNTNTPSSIAMLETSSVITTINHSNKINKNNQQLDSSTKQQIINV